MVDSLRKSSSSLLSDIPRSDDATPSSIFHFESSRKIRYVVQVLRSDDATSSSIFLSRASNLCGKIRYVSDQGDSLLVECVENPPKALKKIIPARIQPHEPRNHASQMRIFPPILHQFRPLRILRYIPPRRRKDIAPPLLFTQHMIVRLLLQLGRSKKPIHLRSQKTSCQQLIAAIPAADPNQMNVIRHQNINRTRSEEHTSELQSRGHLVCRLLL